MIRIEIVYSPAARQVDSIGIDLPEAATLASALSACEASGGWLSRHGLTAASVDAGVWGRRQPPGYRLHDGDRVEIYRPLRCDPKEARRQRHSRLEGSRAPRLSQRERRESA